MTYTTFKDEMKKDYTILIPTMLPMHFSMFQGVFEAYGYKTVLLDSTGTGVIERGLRYVHNDTCYPAQLVIGQLMEALESGKYDMGKVALMISQTGGGCRASNYIFLLRKALDRAGMGHIPVLSINFSGMEKDSSLKMTLPMLRRLVAAVFYGDLMMTLRNQCRPYEICRGDTQKVADKWTAYLREELKNGRLCSGRDLKKTYPRIIADFASIPRRKRDGVRVGIVGEIFVKFSPLGNNNLEEFLISEGAEPYLPDFLGFCLYCVYNGIVDHKLYGRGKLKATVSKWAYKFLLRRQRAVIAAIKEEGSFDPPGYFEDTRKSLGDMMGIGMKMGEGWLLTAEMLELIHHGVSNIVCTQPFGCLPNHIVGKGMMKPLKEAYPEANIVAIDYDAGATRVNQENRIKLMLANAKEKQKKSEEKETASAHADEPVGV